MTTAQHLAHRLREVILEGTWIANTNYRDQLQQIDWEMATDTTYHTNSIAILAQHIHYYVLGIKNALSSRSLDISDSRSFDFTAIDSSQKWKDFQEKFWADTQELAATIEQMSEEQMSADFFDKKYGSYQRNFEGLIEHSYHHLGQVVLLHKMLRAQTSHN